MRQDVESVDKYDAGKLRWSLLPAGFVRGLVTILADGARKYRADGWQAVESPRTRYYDALCRHVEDWWGGERCCPESGSHHLLHAAANCAFLWWFDQQKGTDENP